MKKARAPTLGKIRVQPSFMKITQSELITDELWVTPNDLPF